MCKLPMQIISCRALWGWGPGQGKSVVSARRDNLSSPSLTATIKLFLDRVLPFDSLSIDCNKTYRKNMCLIKKTADFLCLGVPVFFSPLPKAFMKKIGGFAAESFPQHLSKPRYLKKTPRCFLPKKSWIFWGKKRCDKSTFIHNHPQSLGYEILLVDPRSFSLKVCPGGVNLEGLLSAC